MFANFNLRFDAVRVLANGRLDEAVHRKGEDCAVIFADVDGCDFLLGQPRKVDDGDVAVVHQQKGKIAHHRPVGKEQQRLLIGGDERNVNPGREAAEQHIGRSVELLEMRRKEGVVDLLLLPLGVQHHILSLEFHEAVQRDDVGLRALIAAAVVKLAVIVAAEMLHLKLRKAAGRKTKTVRHGGIDIISAQSRQIALGAVVGILILCRKEGAVAIDGGRLARKRAVDLIDEGALVINLCRRGNELLLDRHRRRNEHHRGGQVVLRGKGFDLLYVVVDELGRIGLNVLEQILLRDKDAVLLVDARRQHELGRELLDEGALIEPLCHHLVGPLLPAP